MSIKQKNKRKKFLIDKFTMNLYKANITFLFGDEDKYYKYLKEKFNFGKDIYPLGGSATEFTKKDGQKEYVLYLPSLDYACLAHEATHLAGYIFEWRKITVNYGHEEHFAYMVEWIVREYLKFIKK